MLTTHLPCRTCGAALPVKLGQQRIDCAHCGSHQKLPADVDARLRAHHHRVEAAMELAEVRRKRVAEGGVILNGCLFIVLPIAVALFALVQFSIHGELLGSGIAIAAIAGIVGYASFTGYRSRAQTKKTIGSREVKCGACGAGVPLCAGDITLECPFCSSPLHLTDAAFDASIVAAEEDLAKANRAWKRLMGEPPDV